jgi:UDP-N-acetylglucosamine 4,6-dehydratase/5-epimerase
MVLFMNKSLFKNQTILITGATGSIGSAITEKILNFNCKVVRAMSNDEDGIYKLSEDLTKKNEKLSINMQKNKIRYFVGDIRDPKRCEEICQNVDILIHAAAMKHVPICEYNPQEALKTNVEGTRNLIKAALKCNVKKFLFISTDKVVNPTSQMGKSKLRAENLILKENKNINKNKTKFSIIRFGNIIGSRGSVLPKFLFQIKNNQNLTVTSKNMTRFFLTINHAVNMILNAIDIMKGSEIFIIKNMDSIKIYELALALKEYYNFSKKITINGEREGEKLYEELTTDHEKEKITIYRDFIILRKKKLNKKSVSQNIILNSNLVKKLSKEQIISFLKKNRLLN